MASGLNKVILIGNLGKDPEVRSFETGKNVRFTLATNEDYKTKSGDKASHTEWHNISLWRGLADIAEKYLRKGSQVYIEGRIRYRSYEQEGVKKFYTEIEGDSMVMLSSGNAGQNNGPQAAPNAAEQPAPEPLQPNDSQIFNPPTSEDDDLPF